MNPPGAASSSSAALSAKTPPRARARVELLLNGVVVPAEVDVDVIAAAVVELLPAEPWPEWMSVETAARYLDVPVERLRKLTTRRSVPFHQEGKGCRVFYSRAELDEWMRELGR